MFVPAVVEPDPAPTTAAEASAEATVPTTARIARIELEVDGVTVRIGRRVPPAMIAAVIRALKAAS